MTYETTGSTDPKRLQRSLVDRRVAGVCGGIARYFETDPAFIRVLWLVLTVAGILGLGIGILLGVFGYVFCWLIIPEAEKGSEPIVQGAQRLERSVTNVQLAGVCGGLAEYFSVDASAVRVLWVLLTICTVVIGGLFLYVAAWVVMPAAAAPAGDFAAAGAGPSPPPTQDTASPTDAAAPESDSTVSATDTTKGEPQS